MKKSLLALMHQLITQIHNDALISPKIRDLAHELQLQARYQFSSKGGSISTGSPSSIVEVSRSRRDNCQVQVLPFEFDLSPIQVRSQVEVKGKGKAHCGEIRIQEDELFCNQSEEAEYLEKRNKGKSNAMDQSVIKQIDSGLSSIEQLPQQQNLSTVKKIFYGTNPQRRQKWSKRYNYLALAEGSFNYTTV